MSFLDPSSDFPSSIANAHIVTQKPIMQNISMTMLRLAMNCASVTRETFEGAVGDKKTLQFTLQVKKKEVNSNNFILKYLLMLCVHCIH